MKLNRRQKRIIKKHLEDRTEPCKGYNGVTKINYGFEGRKTITPEMIEFYKKKSLSPYLHPRTRFKKGLSYRNPDWVDGKCQCVECVLIREKYKKEQGL